MNDVTVVQTPKGHTTIHYKGKLLATISGAGRTREERLELAKKMASSLEHHDSNSAAMREALLIVKRLFDGRIMFQPAIRKAHEAVDAALVAPARNCDALSADNVKSRFKERMASSDMGLIGENIVEVVSGVVDFLYATEKGGAE